MIHPMHSPSPRGPDSEHELFARLGSLLRRRTPTICKKLCGVVGMLIGILPALVLADSAPGYLYLDTLSLQRPSAIAVDSQENLYVVEASTNQLHRFDAGGRLLQSTNDLSRPFSVAVNDDGLIFVGSRSTGEVKVFSRELSHLYSLGRGEGEFLRPAALVAAGDLVYVADAKAHRIMVYDAGGALLFSFGAKGDGPGEFTVPVALAVNLAGGELIVADLQRTATSSGTIRGARIQVFSLNGEFKRSFGEFGQGAGKLTMPLGLAVDSLERIYVADVYQNVVQVFDAGGVFLESVYSTDHPFKDPLDLAVGPLSGRLFIVAAGSGTIERYGLPIFHTVDLAASAGGAIGPAGIQTVLQGASLAFSVTPENGYCLADVLVDAQSIGQVFSGRVTNILTSHWVEARFAACRFTISTLAGDGGRISPVGPVAALEGDTKEFSIIPDSYYSLGELIVDGRPTAPLTRYGFSNIQADHTLEARFSRDRYVLTTTVSGAGQVLPAGSTMMDAGSEQEVTIIAAPGYRIDTVLLNDIPLGPVTSYTVPIVRDSYLHARFSAVPWRISADASKGGNISPVGISEVQPGEDLELIITPLAGFVIDSLVIDGRPEAPADRYLFSSVERDHAITAVFRPLENVRHLKLQVIGSGLIAGPPGTGVCPPDCDFVVTRGADMTLSATPVGGAVFGGWLESCFQETSDSCRLTLNDSVDVAAVFANGKYIENFISGDFSGFPWSTINGWQILADDPGAAHQARPASSLGIGETAVLAAELETAEPGKIVFSFVYDEESANSLRFLMNNQELGMWTGALGRQMVVFDVPSGKNIFSWQYLKNEHPAGPPGLFHLDRIIFPAFTDSTAIPDLKVNGNDGPVALHTNDTVHLWLDCAVSGQPQDSGDWAIVVNSDAASFYYDFTVGRWQRVRFDEMVLALPVTDPFMGRIIDNHPINRLRRALRAALRGGRPELVPDEAGLIELAGFTGLPLGRYVFYFGMLVKNSGKMQFSRFDKVEVTVAPECNAPRPGLEAL